MSEIIVSGSLEEIRAAIQRIKALIDFRKTYGWPLFQPDESWFYYTEEDERVCSVCQMFGAIQEFSGDETSFEFPDKETVQPLPPVVRPRVHMTYSELYGVCRCWMVWPNYMPVLAYRLSSEMRELI